MSLALVVAVGAFGLVWLGWFGYPLVLAATSRSISRRERDLDPGRCHVSVIVATRESPASVADRVADLRRSAWPHERLDLIIGVDATVAAHIADYVSSCPGVTVVPGDAPGGKAATLNAAVRAARGEVLVFADTAQRFTPATIGTLVEAVSWAGVSAATGQIITDAESGVLRRFWQYELWLRRLESRHGLVVAVTGAAYALRRDAWSPLPHGLICDDLLVPLRALRAGRRVEVAVGAEARDPRRFSKAQQVERKFRTLVGMLQVCAWAPWVLVPWGHRGWFAFLCHKLIRLATPMLVALGGMSLLVAVLHHVPRPAPVLAGIGSGLVIVLLLVIRRAPDELASVAKLLLLPARATVHAARGRWDVWPRHDAR